MPTLRRTAAGGYKARIRIPDRLRDLHSELYGARLEVKLSIPRGVPERDAVQTFNEWKAEIGKRFAMLRARLDGTGLDLSERDAHALAGQWYDWFIARHTSAGREELEGRLDNVQMAIQYAAGEEVSERVDDPDLLWDGDPEIRAAVRPALTDTAETAQFLAAMHLTLTPAAQSLFVDCLYSHLAAALRRLLRQRVGDFSPDEYVKRFPAPETPDAGLTPWQLFDRWVSEKQPAVGTLENWRNFFRAMEAHFQGRSAGSIQPEEANAWIRGLVNTKRTARTVQTTWLRASKAVFTWAVREAKLLSRDPFADVTIKGRAPAKKRQRAFYESEQRTILTAALAVKDTSNPDDAVMRWVPWLQAYSGARAGEMTQLRAEDLRQIDGVWCIHITPDAGTVKSREARLVPLHEHVIEQGFLTFVAEKGSGPLFYRGRKRRRRRPELSNGIDASKTPAAQARQRLAKRIGTLGIPGRSEGLDRNHAWRHTFKQIAERCGISERTSDQITGHAPASEGRKYGPANLEDMAEALKKFPRYELYSASIQEAAPAS